MAAARTRSGPAAYRGAGWRICRAHGRGTSRARDRRPARNSCVAIVVIFRAQNRRGSRRSMKHRWIVACALGLLASPVALSAQQRGNPPGQGQMPPLADVMQAISMGLAMLDEGNVQFLLARNEELKLT